MQGTFSCCMWLCSHFHLMTLKPPVLSSLISRGQPCPFNSPAGTAWAKKPTNPIPGGWCFQTQAPGMATRAPSGRSCHSSQSAFQLSSQWNSCSKHTGELLHSQTTLPGGERRMPDPSHPTHRRFQGRLGVIWALSTPGKI